jgi:IS1 family transposase
MVSMNKLTKEERVRVISALVEGNSIRATVRMTGIAKNTVAKLLVDIGRACERYHDEIMVKLTCKRLQVDEIWSFCYAKQKNVPEELQGQFGYGDVWTWVAIDADTKLIPSWLVGLRTAEYAEAFMSDVAYRLMNRIQLTSDGLKVYLDAVEEAFGGDIDYATLVKLYGSEGIDHREPMTAHKYSPGKVTSCQLAVVQGNPDRKHVSTSYIERQNLTMRMSMRRFTRLTNGFSKKIENLEAAVALHFTYYNFCRIHQTLRVTPAMAAGVSDHVWEIDEIVALIGQ